MKESRLDGPNRSHSLNQTWGMYVLQTKRGCEVSEQSSETESKLKVKRGNLENLENYHEF